MKSIPRKEMYVVGGTATVFSFKINTLEGEIRNTSSTFFPWWNCEILDIKIWTLTCTEITELPLEDIKNPYYRFSAKFVDDFGNIATSKYREGEMFASWVVPLVDDICTATKVNNVGNISFEIHDRESDKITNVINAKSITQFLANLLHQVFLIREYEKEKKVSTGNIKILLSIYKRLARMYYELRGKRIKMRAIRCNNKNCRCIIPGKWVGYNDSPIVH
jgi:hypothetical protein